MNKLAEEALLTESDHIRTHRRWAVTILALYGIIVSIGIMATLVHRSLIVDAKPSAIRVATRTSIP